VSTELRPLKVLALGGLVVAATHGWLLLVPLALAAAAVALAPLGRDRWPRTRAGWVKISATIAVTLTAMLMVIPVLMNDSTLAGTSKGQGYLTHGTAILGGRFTRLTPVLLTGGIALAVALAAYVRNNSRESAQRGLALAVVPSVGLMSMGAIGAYQLAKIGAVSYYFDKLLIGVALVSVPVLVAAIAAHLGESVRLEGKVRKVAAVVGSLLATVSALFVFGLSGLDYRLKAEQALSAPSTMGERVLHAVEFSLSRPFNKTVYVAAVSGDPRAGLCHYYQVSLGLTWTDATRELTGVLGQADDFDGNRHNSLDIEGAAQAAIDLLTADPEMAVVVAPEVLEPVRALLPEEIRSRVLTWDTQ